MLPRIAALLVLATAAGALEITEWDAPWEKTRPRDPAVAPDGRIWFVDQAGHYAAVFDPRRNAICFGTDSNTPGRADLPDG